MQKKIRNAQLGNLGSLRDVVLDTRDFKGRECDWCGQRITSKGGSARDGLTLCKRHRAEKRERDRRNAARRREFEARMAKVAAGSTGGRRVWVQGDCLVCGEPFTSPGAASRYCSRECRATARAARSWVSFEERRTVYVRDGWACQICGEQTSKRYAHDDPWSPTLDHIVPRSHGGTDALENLRLAHLWCNSVRGDLSHYTDRDLREVA